MLDALDLRLDRGERLALVGPSGAGKTTIANLLLRFLDPDRGRVTLAGHDLRRYRQEDVRRTIAVAGQDAHLFSTTIYENVSLARPGASRAEIAEALRAAGIGPWVESLPDGPETYVGEGGASCLAGSGSGSRSPARCSRTPPCWSSTSRRRTSTRSRHGR